MEKERENNPSDNMLEHTVLVAGGVKKIKLAKGKRLSDLIETIKSKYGEDVKELNFEKCNIVVNGRSIDQAEGVEDNPVLSKSSTITIMPTFTGGSRF